MSIIVTGLASDTRYCFQAVAMNKIMASSMNEFSADTDTSLLTNYIYARTFSTGVAVSLLPLVIIASLLEARIDIGEVDSHKVCLMIVATVLTLPINIIVTPVIVPVMTIRLMKREREECTEDEESEHED